VTDEKNGLTRRDFLKGAACATLAASMGLPGEIFADDPTSEKVSRVILIRNEGVIGSNGKVNASIMNEMLSHAVTRLFDKKNPSDAWKGIVNPKDTVGIKTNVWGPLPTPPVLEESIRNGLISAGVDKGNIGLDDRGVLSNKIFQKATAFINVRPLRTHHWSGVGSCIKNMIMFTPTPWEYHGNSCADLALIWNLPAVKDKVKLNILVMMTPLFHGVGAHHFDKKYTWEYKGLLVGIDPVAVDSVGLQILNAHRKVYFKKESPVKPSAHHIVFAETKHKLGVSDLNKIDLIKLGWQKDILI
jgi:Domain of unknown function (DUF362)